MSAPENRETAAKAAKTLPVGSEKRQSMPPEFDS